MFFTFAATLTNPIDFTFIKKTGMAVASVTNQSLEASTPKQWQITVKGDTENLMTADNVSNMIIILNYSASFPQVTQVASK